jgi:arylsulfatase A-like enzyme
MRRPLLPAPPRAPRSTPGLIFVLQIAAMIAALAACTGEQAQDTPSSAPSAATPDSRANIVFILADDLGYADLGVFGGEIPTPNLDALARSGMLLTNFYAGMTCSPTRAMLMSGMDNHLSGLGVMGQPNREDQRGQPGYEGYLNFRVASLAELMSDAGYDTYMTGKWHLGDDVETGPRARGFKRSFVSLDGAAHLGPWDWRGPQPARYRDGDELVYVGENFYSTRVYTEKMIEYVEQDRGDGRPFFAFLAYTAPHWPLQAPDESIARFKGWYDEGYEALYAQRFARQKEFGLVAPDAAPIPDSRFNPRWHTLSDEEKAIEARRMEVYAAMVNDLDSYVGEFIDYLREIGEYDNTFIMFTSDNGPESTRRDLVPPIRDHVGEAYDHSLDNLGRATSYVMYGPNWAGVSASPFNRHKATAFEGGIRVPTFVHYPREVEGDTRTDETGTVMDLLPTFLALAGAEHPGTSYRGREVLTPQGTSLLPILYGEASSVREGEHLFGWELFGHRSVRHGDWKLVWDQAEPPAERRWRLFDLREDPFEQNDLSAREPEQYQEMLAAWERYEMENGVIY